MENLDNKLFCNFDTSFNFLYNCSNIKKKKNIFLLETDKDKKFDFYHNVFYLKNLNFFGDMNYYNDFDNCLVHNNKFELNLKTDLKEILFFEKIEKEKNSLELEITIKNFHEKFFDWKNKLIKELKTDSKEKNFLLKINQNMKIRKFDFELKIKYKDNKMKYLLIEKMTKFVKSEIIYFLQNSKITFIYLKKFLYISDKNQRKKFNNHCDQIKNFLQNKNSKKTFGMLIKGSRKSGKSIKMKKFLEKVSYPFTIINFDRLLNNYKPKNYREFKKCLHDNIAEKNLFSNKIIICFEEFHLLFWKKEENKDVLLKIKIDLEELIKKIILITDKLVLFFISEVDNIEEFNYYIDEKYNIENPKENNLNKIFMEENLNMKEEDIDWLKNLNFGEIKQLINLIKKSEFLKENYKIQFLISQIKGKKLSKSKDYNFIKLYGMRKIKKKIKDIYINPLKFDFLYKTIKIKIPKNILLYGYSGCGKTYLAKSLKSEFKMNFIHVKGPEILDKYIGSSEENIRKLFDEAERNGPSILFFDEFDSIIPKRKSGSNSVTDRIVNQFLVQLDGVNELKNTFVVGATTRPDLIDPAVLRPGRLDLHIFCGLPDFEDRLDFLRKCFKKYGFGEEGDFKRIDDMLKGFSYADIDSIFKNVVFKEWKSREEFEQDVFEAVSKIKPISISKNFLNLKSIYSCFKDKKPLKNFKKQIQIQK